MDLETVDALLRAGADVDRRQADGWAALHLAIHSRAQKFTPGRSQITFAMDESGFRGQAAPVMGSTLPPIVERLINAGADLNIAGQNGMTPLHLAALSSDDSSVAALLAAGAKPDLRDEAGKTALDLARQHRHVKVVALLEQKSRAL